VRLPPTVTASVRDGSMRDYWLARLRQHVQDVYAGVPLAKFPEDLRAYEHLLWQDAPDTIIEIGTYAGGGALWFRDRLRTLSGYGRIARAPRIVSVDVSQDLAREHLSRAAPSWDAEITLVEADVCAPDTPERVAALVPAEARCLVIEDSAHEYDTTLAALTGFARFVPSGGYLVVEDGCVDIDELRASDDWPRGVLPALGDWLATPQGRAFEVRRDLELYGVSCHPRGFLQRRRAEAGADIQSGSA
jgi:cephalosporin hydroxylase